MNYQQMMRSLMWKDIRTVRPLVLVAAMTAVVANVLVFVFWRQGEMAHDTMVGFSYTLWIILPGFVALGAPAMIVGTEHDTGTEGWLRTLPVPWKMIARAKLWVALGAVIVTAVLTTLAFSLMWMAWNRPPQTGFNISALPVFESIGVVSLFAFFIVLLVLLGFILSYLLRSSLVSMLLLVPAFFASMGAAAQFEWLIRSYSSEARITIRVLAAIVTLVVLWMLQMLLARRRYLLPISSLVPSGIGQLSEAPTYRPTQLPVRTQPSPVVSLLWQQLRQTGLMSVTLVGISTALAFLFTATHEAIGFHAAAGFLSLIPLFIMLSASWLGAIVFYGDTVRRRCAFFADRGISPTRIWWTRLVPPAAACLLLLLLIGVVALVSQAGRSDQLIIGSIQLVALMVVLFSFGQLVSQWVDRPLLAFLAAPAYAFISLTPVLYVLFRFDGEFAAIILMAPVLIFATWRLTRHWLSGQTQSVFTAQVLGYTALAVLAPCLWIVTSRFVVPVSHFTAAFIPGVTP